MSVSFGEQLKAAREAQGITLREVSEQTRIALRYLEALEANDFKPLPGGVFNRSFIRTYAKYIGFDDNEALRLYADATQAQAGEEDAPLSMPRHKVYTDENVARSPLINLLLVGGALLLLAAGMYGFLRWYKQSNAPAVAAPPTATNTPPMTNAAPGASPSGSPGAPTPAPAGSFTIQVRAKDKPFYVATGTDGAVPLTRILLKSGEARDFTPQQSLAVEYTEPGGELMDIFVNGQPIALPQKGVGKAKVVSFVINRDDYQKLLQTAQPTPAQ